MWRYNDIDDCIAEIKEQYDRVIHENEELQQKINNFRKDQEIAKADASVKYIRDHSLLIMSDDELAAARAFKNKHYESCSPKNIKTSETWIYTLSGTGIGTVIQITCPYCKKSEDITDISSW